MFLPRYLNMPNASNILYEATIPRTREAYRQERYSCAADGVEVTQLILQSVTQSWYWRFETGRRPRDILVPLLHESIALPTSVDEPTKSLKEG